MTSVDDAILAAMGRGDADPLSADLDPLTCSPAVLQLLVRHEDPRLRGFGLVCLAERLAVRRDEDLSELAGFAASLPGTLDGPPETALAMAQLHLRLRVHLRSRPWPRWRDADLPPRVQIAWLSAEIAARPEALRDERPGELLYQAVRGIGLVDVDEPESFARELMDRPDPVLRAEGLRVAREAVHAGLLAPERARRLMAGLSGSIAGESTTSGAAVDVAVAMLREMAEPWVALDPLPQEHLYRFLGAGPGGAVSAVSAAAIEAAARHGHQNVLRDVTADRTRPPELRRRALELLGDLADRDDIGDLLGIAATDPLLFAGPAIRCLRGLHRRGHFPTGEAVPAIVGLVIADHSVPASQVATVLFTCRHKTLTELTSAAADDPHWPRRMELLVALAAQGTGGLPVGEKVTDLLRTARDPRPFLEAVRALRHTAAEEAVIAALPRAPAAAVEALEAVGGARTVAALRDGLGLDGPDDGGGAVVAHLRPVRHRALEVLWHLTEDPDRRREVLARLDPRDLPDRVAADLGGPDERELALLEAGLDPDKPVAALRRLTRGAGSSVVPTITDLLLRIVSDLAASRAPGASRSAAEPTVPLEAVAAVRDLGARLHERGKIRPRCLLDAANPREAGEALVAGITLDLLDRPELTAAERVILLGLLLQTSHRGIRARVHPLLRHRDRHVRKHVIALLARDADGEDAQALSASLVPLTAAPDVQTARQALLALGHARARWAAPAIAACLDHPNMNVKKTAATALVHAGSPAVVPKLLFWLGRHDNPGLRNTLTEALRVILGDAYAATVIAMADSAADDRTRELLLTGLDGSLSARAVGALADQGSPAGAHLLSLVAAGRLTLGSGTAAELAERMAARGIAPPTRRRPPDAWPDAELDALIRRGWNTEIACSLVERLDRDPGELTAERLSRLRPMLERWLELAAEEPEQRGRVLRLMLRLCPPPWTAEETQAFTRSVRTLVAGLADISEAHRDRLLALLEDTVARPPSTSRLDIAAQIRALPPEAASGRSVLVLLRRCGAVLTRTDLERALAAARAGANPWSAEEETLREAFGPARPVSAAASSGGAEAPEHPAVARWREHLAAAARTPGTLQRFRIADRLDRDAHPPSSRDQLTALIGAFVNAGADARDVLLDWMIELQPLDAPSWTIAEDARRPAPTDRESRLGRGRPRSAVLHERLLELLDDPAQDRREAAARVMLSWPEPRFRLTALRAFLVGRVDLTVSAELAHALTLMSETELRAASDHGSGGEAARERISDVAARLDPPDVDRLIPLLLAWWEHGGPCLHTSAGHALRKANPDVLAEALSGRLETGDWGLLDLLSGTALAPAPALVRARRRLRREGRHDLANKIVLVSGPLRPPDARRQDSAALSALRTRARVPESKQRPTRADLFHLARTGGPEQIRRALTMLAEQHDDNPARGHRHGADRTADRDPELKELLTESLGHPEARVRLHAHRISRKVMNREDYLGQTLLMLNDRQPDIVRSAVKTLGHAAWKPAAPALVDLLTHSHPAVRRAASDGLALIGVSAIPALRHAAGRARPDRRHLYTAALETITSAMSADLEPKEKSR